MDNRVQIELQISLEHELRRGDTENGLVINNGRHHLEFDQLTDPDHPHVIKWTLTGNARSGEFCALDDHDSPGFQWLARNPVPNVFSNLLRQDSNRQLTITNWHRGNNSRGHWYYQLFARFGDKVFGIPLMFACGPSTNPNPSIQNR